MISDNIGTSYGSTNDWGWATTGNGTNAISQNVMRTSCDSHYVSQEDELYRPSFLEGLMPLLLDTVLRLPVDWVFRSVVKTSRRVLRTYRIFNRSFRERTSMISYGKVWLPV